MGIFAATFQIIHQLSGRKPLAVWNFFQQGGVSDTNEIRHFKGLQILVLKYTAHAGVGPRLKHSDQTALGVNRFYRPYGLAHSSGVMGKIIDHRNLPFFAPDFLPPLYPIKGFQGTGDDLQWNFQMVRNGDNRQRIEQIVFAEKSWF